MLDLSTFKLAIQVDGVGYYAVVTLQSSIASTEGVTVDFDSQVPHAYRDAATFGIRYAWEHLPREVRPTSGVALAVKEVRFAPVDTTTALVALAAAQAVNKLFGLPEASGPRVDPASRSVVFPR